jgi:N-methylhydantoinase A
MKRLGIDVGGTFTDVILVDTETGEVWIVKVPTTPVQPSAGVINGIRAVLQQSGVRPEEIDFLGHGTTIATNLLVEGKGARTGLLTTKGFADILEFRRTSRHDRADLYDIFFDNPAPLVTKALRREVPERIRANGEVELPVDVESAKLELQNLKKAGVEAIAVCFLHSYANPAHEQEVIQLCRRLFPELFATASIEVNPEIYEYERTSTTVINAMLGPKCAAYLDDLQIKLKQDRIGCSVHLMQSNGGLTTPKEASTRPVFLLESGPAGGVTAAANLCAQRAIPNALAGDMGGTTFDVSIIRQFQPELRTSNLIDTYTVRAPTIDIVSVGAGGGSLASVDTAGGVNVGPQSAGADPGPACYGRGGTRPTVTDCNLILGYLDVGRPLGGYTLDQAAAEKAVHDHIAKPLGLSITEAARTVRAIANAHMAQAMRLVTIERGYDPREFAYICYGGAGPLHAMDVAELLGITKVIIPRFPGLFSAFGMLVADMVYDFQAPVMQNLDQVSASELSAIFARLEGQVRARLDASGVPASAVELQRVADCRYLGQAEDISVEVPEGEMSAAQVEQIRSTFIANHKRAWNFVMPRPVIINNARVRGIGRTGLSNWASLRSEKGELQPIGKRRVLIGTEFKTIPCYDRSGMAANDELNGPAVIQEASTNLIIAEGQRATVDSSGNLIAEIRGKS